MFQIVIIASVLEISITPLYCDLVPTIATRSRICTFVNYKLNTLYAKYAHAKSSHTLILDGTIIARVPALSFTTCKIQHDLYLCYMCGIRQVYAYVFNCLGAKR